MGVSFAQKKVLGQFGETGRTKGRRARLAGDYADGCRKGYLRTKKEKTDHLLELA